MGNVYVLEGLIIHDLDKSGLNSKVDKLEVNGILPNFVFKNLCEPISIIFKLLQLDTAKPGCHNRKGKKILLIIA